MVRQKISPVLQAKAHKKCVKNKNKQTNKQTNKNQQQQRKSKCGRTVLHSWKSQTRKTCTDQQWVTSSYLASLRFLLKTQATAITVPVLMLITGTLSMEWTWQSVRGKNTLSQIICKVRDEALAQSATPYKGRRKTVLDFGFHTVDSGFQVLDSGYFVSGTLIPDSNRWWDSRSLDPKSRIPDSTTQISWIPVFPEQRMAFSLPADVLRA